jgi:hypothetical protein
MRKLKDLKKKYFICSGNQYCLYEKIDDERFIVHYSDYSGIMEDNENFTFKEHSYVEYKYLNTYEYQSIMRKSILVRELYKKYFG